MNLVVNAINVSVKLVMYFVAAVFVIVERTMNWSMHRFIDNENRARRIKELENATQHIKFDS